MTPEELAVWEPRSGAEILAAEQFKRACNPNAKLTLTYAERITDRTDGPVIRKVRHRAILSHWHLISPAFLHSPNSLVYKMSPDIRTFVGFLPQIWFCEFCFSRQ